MFERYEFKYSFKCKQLSLISCVCIPFILPLGLMSSQRSSVSETKLHVTGKMCSAIFSSAERVNQVLMDDTAKGGLTQC